LEEAIAAYNKALSIKPNYVDAYNNMGNTLKEQGKLEEAIEAYNKALSIKPDYVDAYFNMGNALQDQGKPEEAIEAYNTALSIKPDYAKAYYNIGILLAEQGKLEEAIKAYNKAVSTKPDYLDAYNNIGNTLHDQGKPEEAIEAYNKAISIKPDYAEAHHNLSLALLATKDFDQGFIQSEWRWKTKRQDGTFLKSTKPMWNGEKNQRVLVWNEQGIGDEIMFSSIIPELYTRSLRILVKCDKRLIPLFKRSFPDDIIYFSKDKPVPEDEYDFHIPMGSLPLTFRKSLDSFKKSALGFLKPDTDRAESIKGQLINEQGKKLIGISWKTASPTKNSSNRNINLAELARALDSPNTQLVCLQYGDVSNEIEAVKRDTSIEVIQFSDVDNKHDIDGLAALMAACDTVVTIDNATTHLSGALGLPTKLMLPLKADWRWGVSENSSYWYEAVQLYKQSEFNDWYSVLARI
jgi:Tfp pilus assembly protein PilF